MIVTKEFILLNFPKTGSTYVRECIRQLYLKDTYLNRIFKSKEIYSELRMPKIYGNTNKSYIDQHGVYSQIPKPFLNRPIVSVIRNPLQRVISSFHFEWWKANPLYDSNAVKNKYPDYPNLDLITFAKFLNDAELAPENFLKPYADVLGYNTRLFLIFYCEQPSEAAKKLCEGKYDLFDVIAQDIHFLKQENLLMDLKYFLANQTDKNVDKIVDVEKKNTGDYKEPLELDQEFRDYIYKMDRFIFEAFYPEYLTDQK